MRRGELSGDSYWRRGWVVGLLGCLFLAAHALSKPGWAAVIDDMPGNGRVRRVGFNQSDGAPPKDSDYDGIPDWWVQKYFGHPTGQSSDKSGAGDDPDGDGFVNLEEFVYGTDPGHADTRLDIIVNNGNAFTRTTLIPIQPLSTEFPKIRIGTDPFMKGAAILANQGRPMNYELPDRGDGHYELYLQYADAEGEPRSVAIGKSVTLDRSPPVARVTSPASNVVLNQAFITLRGVACDPDPVALTAMRPLKIWINDQRYWDRSGTNIVIERFPIPVGTNAFTVAIRVEDEAGNSKEVVRTWTVDTSSDTVAPQLSSFNIASRMLLPDVSEVWVEAAVDDENAIVHSIVSSSPQYVTTNSLNVRGHKVEGLVPLDFGTNHVVLLAGDAAGNTSSNLFTIIRSDRYRFAITSPAFGEFATAPSTTVKGYVSAKIDEGLPTETRVARVMINGVAAVLDWANVSRDGNVPFFTTNAILLGVPITGQVVGDRTPADERTHTFIWKRE